MNRRLPGSTGRTSNSSSFDPGSLSGEYEYLDEYGDTIGRPENNFIEGADLDVDRRRYNGSRHASSGHSWDRLERDLAPDRAYRIE